MPTSSSDQYTCCYCNKTGIQSKAGLRLHLTKSIACVAEQRRLKQAKNTGHKFAQEYMQLGTIAGKRKDRADRLCYPVHTAVDLDKLDAQQGYSGDEEELSYPEDGYDLDADDDESMDDIGQPNIQMLMDFRQYARQFYGTSAVNISHKERDAIRLLFLLRQTKAALTLYEEVMKWHFMCNGLPSRQSLGSVRAYVPRAKLFKMLSCRYNLYNKVSLIENIVLPSSRARARIVKNDAVAMMQSLLTDPRIRADDYLFTNNNPLSPPPSAKDGLISDINTGLAY